MDYTKFFNKRAAGLKPSGIRKFFDIVGETPGAISLGVGEPDFITPWEIREAAIRSIKKGYTQYTSNAGTVPLRKQISAYLSGRYGLSYDETEIIVTIGASEAIDLCMRAFVDEGDEVLVPEPSYVSYAPCVTLAGGKAVGIPCKKEHNFKITAEALESAVTDRTKILLLPYPNNPTGAIMEKSELERVAEFVERHDLLVVSDEIYSELTYGKQHVSIASLKNMRERTLVINGFSKAFAMTGWRIGYLAAPKEMIKPLYTVHQYCIMCAPTASQHAATFALSQGAEDNYAVIREMRDEYDRRRRFLYHFFKSEGFDVFEPQGAFYIFPSVESFGLTGEEFAERLLEKEKLAVVPGDAFGESGKYHVRVSYAYSMATLEMATEKISHFIKNL